MRKEEREVREKERGRAVLICKRVFTIFTELHNHTQSNHLVNDGVDMDNFRRTSGEPSSGGGMNLKRHKVNFES